MDKDGQKDIMLLLAQDGRGNQNYALFLLKAKALVEVKGFDELYAPTYDEKKKAIKSTSTHNRGSDVEFYKIVNGQLVKAAGK